MLGPLILSVALVLPPAFDELDRPMPVAVENAGIYGNFAKVEEGYVGGEPTADALRALAAKGVKSVIALRTDSELAGMDYDEAALAKELGMNFTQVPLGGADHPYSRDVLDAVAEAMKAADGEVFLHCRSGTRATNVWTAWLVSEKNMSVEEADARGKAIKKGIDPEILAKLTGS